MRDKCPLTLVDCPFNYAGCETQLPRKDMPEHMKETVTHLMSLATATQRLFVENQKLTKENQELKERALEREDESRRSMEAVQASLQKLMEEIQELKQSTANADNKIRALKEKEQQLRLHLQQLINTSERLFVKYTEEEVDSPAFYTHTHDYRMCVCVAPNGYGNGEGTHVSVFIFMMCGPFDKFLKWPFRGSVTIHIVNQAGDHDHFEKTIHFTDRTPNNDASRVAGSGRATSGWGNHQVLVHADLGYNVTRKTQYLKDNHIVVRVVKVVLK